jgi:hypothetical protein
MISTRLPKEKVTLKLSLWKPMLLLMAIGPGCLKEWVLVDYGLKKWQDGVERGSFIVEKTATAGMVNGATVLDISRSVTA